MVEEIIVSLAVAVVGGVAARMMGLFRVGKNVRRCMVEVERAQTDYSIQRKRVDREFAEKVRQIDEDHNARGMYDSGERVHALRRAAQDAELSAEADLRQRARRITDAFGALRPIDRAWLAIKYRKSEYGDHNLFKAVWIGLAKRPLSMEDDVLEPVLRKSKEETQG